MKKNALKRFIVVTLVIAMVLGASIAGSAKTTFSDINGHWATASINSGVAKGFIKGYADGTFKPNNPVSRAEFSKMLNAAYGIENTQSIGFKDIYSKDWYYSEVRKAVAAGYIRGYEDNTFRPNRVITRQEAAIIIASVVPKSGKNPSLSGLVDNASIADWAREGVLKVYAKGYMRGDNNNFYNPTKALTRAEAATILANLISKENIISADTTVSISGKTLSDTIYANNLTISKSLGTGSVELNTCMVLGTLHVLGGGTSSVSIIDTGIHKMNFAKTTGDVRVLLSGYSTVKDTQVENGGTLEQKDLQGSGFQNIHLSGSALATQEVKLIGNFPQLYLDTAAIIKSSGGTISNTIITSSASGDAVKLGGNFTNVTFEAKTLFELLNGKITNLTVNSGASSSTVKMSSNTSITTAVVNAIKTVFTGSGTISRLEANANDILYESKPAKIISGSNVSRPPKLSNLTEITIKAIAGLTVPVTGAKPDTTISSNSEYTATVTWSPTVSSTYLNSKVYTATITITPKTGYTLSGVKKNFFTVAGGTATNAVNSGVVTAVFPTTGTQATAPKTIILAKGTSNQVGGVANVAIPAASGTDKNGRVTGWVNGTADKIKFTVTDAGAASSTIKINGVNYTSGVDYKITDTSTLTIVVTTVETGRVTGVRTFTITVTSATATSNMALTLTTPTPGSGNTITGGGATKTVAVNVVNNTSSVVITGTKLTSQKVIVSGADMSRVTASGFSTTPTYLVDTSSIATGGSRVFSLTVSEVDKVDIVYSITVVVAPLNSTGNMALTLTTPAPGSGNTITGGGETKTVAVNVIGNTTSVVIAGTKSASQTVVVSGPNMENIGAFGTLTNPTYLVDTSTIAAGGSRVFLLTVSEVDKADIVYSITVTVMPLSSEKSITGTTVGILSGGSIIGVPAGTKASALIAAITISPNALKEILIGIGGSPVADQENTEVTAAMVIKVTAENSTTAEYTIEVQ